MTAIAQEVRIPTLTIKPRFLVAVIAVLGVLFQIGHFVEHAVQFGVWLLSSRNTPYMSPVAMACVRFLGNWLFPAKDPAVRMMLGMEVLHLIGNSIFLVTIGSLFYFIRSKFMRYAFYVELFHLYEHIMLTLTALFLGKSVGLSTLFGGAATLGGQQFALGYRVSWHFVMNLIPSTLIMIAIMQKRQKSAG
ncbi:MAG: hypothetical protein JWN50_385 [Parcubacteria group bacterium]|nr:hypothetical protein [Parcubacteria group bacterium]